MISKKWMRSILAGILVLAAALVASGCSSSSNKGASVNVDMLNFAFQPDKTSVPAGEVTFHVKNSDSVEHEMVVIKTDLDAMQLPTDSAQRVDEGKLQSEGEVEVDANGSKDLTVNLTPGHYVLLCNLPGHYAQGMATNFTVQ